VRFGVWDLAGRQEHLKAIDTVHAMPAEDSATAIDPAALLSFALLIYIVVNITIIINTYLVTLRTCGQGFFVFEIYKLNRVMAIEEKPR